MLFLAICTEGENSEPAIINEYINSIVGQTRPPMVEIVAIPVGGNQGHTNFFNVADKTVDTLKSDDKSLLSLIEENDQIEKWAICDYDNMHKSGLTEEEFRNLGKQAGYNVIINKPNIEFFVLSLLTSIEYASNIPISQYKSEINKAVLALNGADHNKGMSSEMDIPPYSKKEWQSKDFFGKVFTRHPGLIKKVLEQSPKTGDRYSEMHIILNIIEKLCKNEND